MPYIKQSVRDRVDLFVESLISELQDTAKSQHKRIDGSVNYVISRIVAGAMKPDNGWNYDSLSDAYKTFFAAAAEFQNRLMADYERKAKEKNGDIPEYE